MLSFPLFHLLELLLLGAALGFTGGLFGIGGGIIAIPVLILGFHLDQAAAQGTALVMMVPNLLVAWWRYTRHNPLPRRDVAGVALAGTLTTWAMAQAAHWLDQGLLRALFAGFLLFLAVRMAGGPKVVVEDTASATGLDRRLLPLVGAAGGASMGLLGIGGGLVATPLFSRLFGLGQRMSQNLGLALVAPSSVIALGTYAGNGHVDWPLGACLALGGVATVAAGVSAAHRLPEHLLRRIFGVMVGSTGSWLLAGPYLIR